jgi:predicted ester cyclase
MRAYRSRLAAAFLVALGVGAYGLIAEAEAASELDALVAHLPSLRGDHDKRLARIVLPLYDALNRPATKDVAHLLEEATSADWQACGENDSACGTRDQVIAGFNERGRVVPNLAWQIKEILVEGNRVIVRGEGSGTPVDTFLGLPPRGKSFRVMSIDIHTIEHDKIVKTHHLEDWLDAVQQLK